MHVRHWSLALAAGLILVAAAVSSAAPPERACLTPEHLFLFEDADGVFLDPASNFGDHRAVMVEAANALVATHGDSFDFIGFFTDFEPARRPGGAVFNVVWNDVEGLGLPLFDNRPLFGLDSQAIEGFAQMYDLHERSSVRNALAHEFAHRWAAYLPVLDDGRDLTRGGHFSCAFDQQGGNMGAEWRGEEGRVRRHTARRNVDTRGRYSWFLLYLMGLASPMEVEAEMQELRFMDQVDQNECANPYAGPVSPLFMADVVSAAGPRSPDDLASQKAFRSAWIVLHAPGAAPRDNTLRKIVRILERFSDEWRDDTLGRSTMDVRLFDDDDCDGVVD